MDGREREFSHAFEAYSDELFRHCALRLRDRERAVELTQEAFLRVWDYIHKGGTIEQMRPFLYRTLRHLIIDEYRKKKAVSLEKMVEDSEYGVEDVLPADESNTLERAIEHFDGVRVLEALTRLPEPYRESVTMRYVDGLSPQEIAAILDESENVVSVRVHRGLKKLKEMLEPKDTKHHA
jgi:RNA polymerase sigma-70 factor (ECF subfamily)